MHEITARINAANSAPTAETKAGLAAIARSIYGDEPAPVLGASRDSARAANHADKANRAAFDALAAQVYGSK